MSKSLQSQLLEVECESEALSLIRQDAQKENRFSWLLSRAKSLRTLIEIGSEQETNGADAEYREQFKNYILSGRLPELRTYQGLNSFDLSLGGVLCAAEYQRELFQDAGVIEPLLDENIVRFIRTKTGNALTLPTVDMTELTSSIVAQNTDTPPVANPTASKATFGAFSYKVTPVAVSAELQEDAFQPIDKLLQQCFSTAIANGAGADLISGSGSGAPQGVLTAATDSTITTASPTAITADEIESVYFALPRIHRVNPKTAWVMSDAVYQMVRKAVDGNQRPLLTIVNDQEQLLSRRVLVSPSMDPKKFVLANLSQYVVRVATDSVRIRVAREAYGYAETNTQLLSCTFRLDAKMIKPASSVAVAVFGTIAAS